MASNSSLVRIAMRDKHYNERCEIQHAAMKVGLDLIPSFSDHNLVVVDYGCAQGANSIEPIEKVISTLPDGAIASLVFEDTPFNDFGTLAKTIAERFNSKDDAKVQIVPSLVPLGFFRQVVPTAQADIGFSWSSFNYLEKTPSASLDATASPAEFAAARHKALAAAGHTDLIKILKLRAKEIRTGGYLIAAIGGQMPEGETRPSKPGAEVLQSGLMRMVAEGKLSFPELMQMALFPGHERTPKELQAALDDEAVAPLWEVESLEPKLIVQPAWEVYQDRIRADESVKDEAMKEYAQIVINNLVAAAGWLWVDVLKKSRGEGWDGGDAFLDEFINIAVEEFVTKHADFKAEIWYNYIKLKRTDKQI
ncbi:Benzoate carboxyl methyltransferase [Fusarium austroafricanum]|uniref:Benzoate carboxyl methyltransferase n=1 Tax=Fusarium austroafricanum TaxID=2364996 RepID=A0A8H4NWA4_9HYPO|nr:Benzoate carboxyl methyltransferase [Fusarium austroafricanum]